MEKSRGVGMRGRSSTGRSDDSQASLGPEDKPMNGKGWVQCSVVAAAQCISSAKTMALGPRIRVTSGL